MISFTVIYTALKTGWSFLSNKYVLYIVSLLLIVGVGWWGWHHITTSYYNAGVASQKLIYDNEQQELKTQIQSAQADADIARAQLNQALSDLQSQKLQSDKELADLQVKQKQDLLNYEKTHNSIATHTVCFKPDDSGLLLIKNAISNAK